MICRSFSLSQSKRFLSAGSHPLVQLHSRSFIDYWLGSHVLHGKIGHAMHGYFISYIL